MTIEKLKALLESGAITQEEFETMAATLGDPAPAEPPADPAPAEPPADPAPNDEKFSRREIQAMIDRAMAKERKEKVDLQKKYDKLQRKMLTDEEAKQLELEEQQKEFEQQKRELALEKNKMYAVKSMKKANLNDTEETMLIMEKLVASCEDETDIDEIIDLLASCINNQVGKKVEAEVSKRFKDNSYTPKKGDSLNGGINPWKKEHWNITDQMALELSNPDLAKQLQAAAGVK